MQICVGQNIIQNGNFENGTHNWYLIQNDNGASVTINNTNVFQGNNSMQLEIFNIDSTIIAGVYQIIPIQPNTTYIFSYAIKTDLLDYMVYPYMKFNDGTDIFVQSGYFSGYSKDWTLYEMRFTTPETVINLDFFVFLVGNSGKVWIDSLVLTKIESTTDLNFSVDLNSTTETFNNLLLCTNSSPIRLNSPNDLSNDFIEIGIPEVRTHDIYNTCDINVIFPNFSADPLDPDSYDFSATDEVIQSIINVGAKPFFRLGYSYVLNPVYNVPPEDFGKWASICAQIVKHYNEGWNNGFYFDIEKWEVWNEPDLTHCWTGTPQQFYELYCQAAVKIKNVNPNLKVGAAGFANINNANFIKPFLDSISSNNTPLDFISYHSYIYTNPFYYTLQYQDLIGLLTEYNLEEMDVYLTEWNNYPYNSESTIIQFARDDAMSAALTASSFYYLQYSNLSGAYRYRTDEYFFGLFRDNGELSYSGLAFKAISNLKNNVLLHTTGNDSLGSICIAGRSKDDNIRSIIVSNPNNPSSFYTLELRGLTQTLNYLITRINSNNEFIEVESGIVFPGNNTITSSISPPFVDLITLTVATGNNYLIKDSAINIFPNPTNEILNIETDINYTSAEVNIYSLLGEKILTVKNLLVINISDIPNGLYFVNIRLDNYIRTFKIAKIE